MGKKRLGLLLSLGLLFGVGMAAIHSSPIAVNAEEIVESDSTSEAIKETVATETEETIKETISKYWDEFVAPLFVGVTGTSVVSAILSIGVAIINRKNNKVSKEEVKKSHDDVSEVVKLAAQMITNFGNILDAVEKQNEISREMKEAFVQSSNQLLEKVAMLTNKTEDLMKLKQIIVTQAAINSKIALASREVIASGVGEDIVALTNQIKQL